MSEPTNPLVHDDGAEDTWLAIDGVLALLQQYGMGLEHMEAVPKTKLKEVGDE